MVLWPFLSCGFSIKYIRSFTACCYFDRTDAGHFTQMVWKSSRELGVGKAKSRDGRQVYVVCVYFPAGNCVGQYGDNVVSPR